MSAFKFLASLFTDLEIPYTTAPNDFKRLLKALPTKPVIPVINILLFFKLFSSIFIFKKSAAFIHTLFENRTHVSFQSNTFSPKPNAYRNFRYGKRYIISA